MKKFCKFLGIIAIGAVIMAASAVVLAGCDNPAGGGEPGVEDGNLAGSVWVRSSKSSGQWDFTYTRTFTSDSAGTDNQKGWGMVGNKKQNYNTTTNFTYIYYPNIGQGVIGKNTTKFSVSSDYKTLTEGSTIYTRQ
ncbi:MAG: hypothetical protein LBG26_02530 [Treponema sp.]|jgi:hypothetical protein|nr:hypothetical protein [Treponema sp.]